MGHLIDANGHSQDDRFVLAGFDLNPIRVADAKLLLGDLDHLVPALTDGVFVI